MPDISAASLETFDYDAVHMSWKIKYSTNYEFCALSFAFFIRNLNYTDFIFFYSKLLTVVVYFLYFVF